MDDDDDDDDGGGGDDDDDVFFFEETLENGLISGWGIMILPDGSKKKQAADTFCAKVGPFEMTSEHGKCVYIYIIYIDSNVHVITISSNK